MFQTTDAAIKTQGLSPNNKGLESVSINDPDEQDQMTPGIDNMDD